MARPRIYTRVEAQRRAKAQIIAWWAANGEKERAKHATQRKSLRAFIWAYKSSHPCIECGESDPRCLDFDHRDPNDKKFEISSALARSRSIPYVAVEMAKCDIRCANCHRKRTYDEEHWTFRKAVNAN